MQEFTITEYESEGLNVSIQNPEVTDFNLNFNGVEITITKHALQLDDIPNIYIKTQSCIYAQTKHALIQLKIQAQ